MIYILFVFSQNEYKIGETHNAIKPIINTFFYLINNCITFLIRICTRCMLQVPTPGLC